MKALDGHFCKFDPNQATEDDLQTKTRDFGDVSPQSFTACECA